MTGGLGDGSAPPESQPGKQCVRETFHVEQSSHSETGGTAVCSWHTRAAPPCRPPDLQTSARYVRPSPPQGVRCARSPAESFNAIRSALPSTLPHAQRLRFPVSHFLVHPIEAGYRLKQLLRERDGDACHWCKRTMIFAGPQTNPLRATLEHVTRRADGGTSHPSNLRLACRRCNSSRHTPGWTPPTDCAAIAAPFTLNAPAETSDRAK